MTFELKPERKERPQKLQNWGTPDHVFDYASRRWGPFTVDLAAEACNARCPYWFGIGGTLGADGTQADLAALYAAGHTHVWCNPPFGNIAPFIELLATRPRCMTVAFLTPSDRFYADWTRRATSPNDPCCASEMMFIRPRVNYVDPLGTPAEGVGFGSMFWLWRTTTVHSTHTVQVSNLDMATTHPPLPLS